MSKTYSDDEIREAMLKTHRESYEFWSRLINATKEKEQIKALYRYREGFDQAIMNLARKLGINLAREESIEKPDGSLQTGEPAGSVREGTAPTCSQCAALLFKVAKSVWNCPQCKINYLIREE